MAPYMSDLGRSTFIGGGSSIFSEFNCAAPMATGGLEVKKSKLVNHPRLALTSRRLTQNLLMCLSGYWLACVGWAETACVVL